MLAGRYQDWEKADGCDWNSLKLYSGDRYITLWIDWTA